MATLRNKRKLAAVSRETPESTRSGRTQSILDPELTQDYISQVSEEIEGRVTKKLSKEFSRTESRILGASSKLYEFLLNPQIRTCSVAVPGTSRSGNLENQGTNEDRPSDDPGPEVEYSSPHFGAETNPHMVTGVTSETRQHPHIRAITIFRRDRLSCGAEKLHREAYWCFQNWYSHFAKNSAQIEIWLNLWSMHEHFEFSSTSFHHCIQSFCVVSITTFLFSQKNQKH